MELDTFLNMDEQGAEPIAGEEYGDGDEELGGTGDVGDSGGEPGGCDADGDPDELEVKPSINEALEQPLPPHTPSGNRKREEEVR